MVHQQKPKKFLSWMSKDGKIILAANGMRSFAYGFVSVILGIYLGVVGFDSFQIGVVLTLILASGATSTILASFYADRIGRRRVLFIESLLMATSGLIYALTSNQLLLVLGAFTGTMSPSGADVASFLSLEQAMLPQSVSTQKINSLYSVYNTAGQLLQSGGTLFAALPVEFQSYFHLSQADSYHPLFAIYAVIALGMAALYLMISAKMELLSPERRDALRQMTSMTRESKILIGKFAAILGVDAFAGGLVIQTIISYWFYSKFGVPLQYLALIIFVGGLFSSLSLYLSGRVADRIGAIRTMVFSHLPADFLLIGIPLAPTFPVAMSLYVARALVTTMDIPARQAYTVSVVRAHERTAASGITNVARNSARSVSPSLTGYAFQTISLSFPFFIAGGVYVVSDVVLYFAFREVKERQRREKKTGMKKRKEKKKRRIEKLVSMPRYYQIIEVEKRMLRAKRTARPAARKSNFVFLLT